MIKKLLTLACLCLVVINLGLILLIIEPKLQPTAVNISKHQISEQIEKNELSDSISNAPISPTPKVKTFSLIAGGDLMFDRSIRSAAEKNGGYDWVFDAKLTEFLRSADYVLANLEGPITQAESISQFSQPGEKKNFIFTFSEAIIPTLIKNNLTLLHLGNNHILNFGAQGLTSTKESLTQANLISFGNVSENLQSTEASNRFYLLEKFGQKIALISYNQFMTNGKNVTLADLKTVQAAGANLIILYTHWGNEYQEKAPAVIVELAHEFIDAGVDLIIGSHPHVIQNKEIYQNKTIYYSLGNFVFDQYFSAETASGLLLKIDFVFDTNTKLWSYRVNKQMIKMSTDGKTYLLGPLTPG